MKRLFILLSLLGAAASLSCSKPPAPAPVPTPVPTAVSIPIDLGVTETPTPEPLEYVLEDMKGTVLIRESGEAQAEPAAEEETVEEGDEIITQAGSEASLTLDENTMFHLSENSDVQVSQLRPNPSNGFVSRLMLLGGKVLSEVEKLGSTHSTFEIESGGVICGVRGTAFEVQKEGETIHTDTFHGEVEMRKGTLVQAVVAGHHSAFLYQKGAFEKPRILKPAENQYYHNWLAKKEVVQQKQAQRLAAIRSLSNLPPEQRKRMMEDLKTAKPRDRMRLMHQMLKPGAQTRPGMGLKPERPLLRQGKTLKERRNGHQEGRDPRRNGPLHGNNPNLHKGQGQNFQKREKNLNGNKGPGAKPLLRPQGNNHQQVLHPNHPGRNKPVNKPKFQPQKPGKPQGKVQKKEDQKKGKKKKDREK